MSKAKSTDGSAISKSKFFSLPYTNGSSSQVGVKQYYDFIFTNDEKLKKVPVAITGSTNTDIFWQIGGSNMNGDLAEYLREINPRLLQEANKKLRDEGPKKRDLKDAIGRVEAVDFTKIGGFKAGSQVEKILYSASPSLATNPAEAKAAMIAFGEKFRNQLYKKGVGELCLPLFSGGFYRGSNSQQEVAEWLMEGWFLAETKASAMPEVTVYLGHQCLVDAVQAKGIQCEKHLSSATTSPALSGTKSVAKGGSVPRSSSTGSVKKASSGSVAKDLKSRNSRDFAYSDREIDAVNIARNTQDRISYLVLDGATTNILLNRDGNLLKEDGKTVVELPACDAMGENSPITGHLTAQFAHLDELERRGAVIYPLKILFPYKVEGWHWNAGEIIVAKDGAGKFRIEGRAYDPYGRGGCLNPKIQGEIRNFFTGQPGFGNANFQLNIVSNIKPVQRGGVACGLYAARAIHNLKTKDSSRIWDGVLFGDAIKIDQGLRDEDSALVEMHCLERTKAQFCAPIDERAYKKGTSKGAYEEEQVQAATILRSIERILKSEFNEKLSTILVGIVYSGELDMAAAYDKAYLELASVHKDLPGIFFENESGNRGKALFTFDSIELVYNAYSGAKSEPNPKAGREGVAKGGPSSRTVTKSFEGKPKADPEFNHKHVDKWSSGTPAKGELGTKSPNTKPKTLKVSTSTPAHNSESIIFSEDDPEFNPEYVDKWSLGSSVEEGVEAEKLPLKLKSTTPESASSEYESASVEDSESALSEDGSEDESTSYSEPILSDCVEIEGMKSVGDNKIELDLRDKEGENEPVVIDISENRLLEVSSDGGEVQIKVEDFRKELMDYYKGEESYAVGEDGKVVELKKDALEVLRIYQAVPSTSVALRSVSHVVVGNLSKPR